MNNARKRYYKNSFVKDWTYNGDNSARKMKE